MIDDLNKWYLNNCGLVIVHPFLHQLFKLLDYLDENGKFQNKAVQERAVRLVHFIGTGETSPDNESEMAMSKILCGLLISDVISMRIELTVAEKQNAVELMNALINHWDKLGNTSPEGLRNTFLKRNGLLEFKDKAYQLSIESSGTDILLDYLPWNINMIKLPWSELIIFTAWR